jgi:formate dehydrogenase accessory protein FdhD
MGDPDRPPVAGPFPGLGYRDALDDRAFTALSDAGARPEHAAIAEEVPVAFIYHLRTHAVMMATPADLEDLAVGFTLTEAIVPRVADITRVEVSRHSRGIEVTIDIPDEAADSLLSRARALAGRSGCGICGVEAIDDAVRVPSVIPAPITISAGALWHAGAALDARQTLNLDTHAIHGAAWATADGDVRVVREDVGRHNALDKALGALARAGTDPSTGFLLVTSRASFELVQKAALCGVSLLAAVSRPTGLAIRMADAAGMCLVGLLRGRTANVYTHAERIR